jgi:hypothetical protein
MQKIPNNKTNTKECPHDVCYEGKRRYFKITWHRKNDKSLAKDKNLLHIRKITTTYAYSKVTQKCTHMSPVLVGFVLNYFLSGYRAFVPFFTPPNLNFFYFLPFFARTITRNQLTRGTYVYTSVLLCCTHMSWLFCVYVISFYLLRVTCHFFCVT